ncbi:MAG: DUF2147 domain-containing protein [Pseudomonadota bacterium]
MKKTLLALGLTLIATAGIAQDIRGDWRTAPDDNGNTGIIRVSVCDGAYCGTLVQSFDASGNTMETENNGRQIIWATKPTGDGAELRGKIYAPDRDSTYNSRLTLKGDTLEVCGRLLGITRCGGDWTRVN